jgi:hypothetical protein
MESYVLYLSWQQADTQNRVHAGGQDAASKYLQLAPRWTSPRASKEVLKLNSNNRTSTASDVHSSVVCINTWVYTRSSEDCNWEAIDRTTHTPTLFQSTTKASQAMSQFSISLSLSRSRRSLSHSKPPSFAPSFAVLADSCPAVFYPGISSMIEWWVVQIHAWAWSQRQRIHWRRLKRDYCSQQQQSKRNAACCLLRHTPLRQHTNTKFLVRPGSRLVLVLVLIIILWITPIQQTTRKKGFHKMKPRIECNSIYQKKKKTLKI